MKQTSADVDQPSNFFIIQNPKFTYVVVQHVPFTLYRLANAEGADYANHISTCHPNYTSQVLQTFEKRCSPKPFGQTK